MASAVSVVAPVVAVVAVGGVGAADDDAEEDDDGFMPKLISSFFTDKTSDFSELI